MFWLKDQNTELMKRAWDISKENQNWIELRHDDDEVNKKIKTVSEVSDWEAYREAQQAAAIFHSNLNQFFYLFIIFFQLISQGKLRWKNY